MAVLAILIILATLLCAKHSTDELCHSRADVPHPGLGPGPVWYQFLVRSRNCEGPNRPQTGPAVTRCTRSTFTTRLHPKGII